MSEMTLRPIANYQENSRARAHTPQRSPYATMQRSQRLISAARKAGVRPLTPESIDAWARESGWLKGPGPKEDACK